MNPEAAVRAGSPEAAERADAASAGGRADCLNCGAPLRGPYCAACGQEDRDPDPPAHVLAREMAADALGADSATVRTLRLLLLRPGALTAEYFAGRRARYLAPLRLYLLLSFPFVAMALLTPAGESMIHVDPPEDVTLTPEAYREAFLNLWPGVLVLLAPLYAASYALLLRGRRASFTRHLVFTLHLHAFGFAAVTLGTLLWYVPPDALGTGLAMAMVFTPGVYLVLALRGAYGVSRTGSLLVAAGAVFLNSVVTMASVFVTLQVVAWLR